MVIYIYIYTLSAGEKDGGRHGEEDPQRAAKETETGEQESSQ